MVFPLRFTSLESLCSVPNMQLRLTSAYIIPSSSWCLFCTQCEQHYLASVWDLQARQKIYICPTNSAFAVACCHPHTQSSRGILFSLSYSLIKNKELLQIVTGLEKLGSVSARLDHSLAYKTLFTAQFWELTFPIWAHEQSDFLQGEEYFGGLPPLHTPGDRQLITEMEYNDALLIQVWEQWVSKKQITECRSRHTRC